MDPVDLWRDAIERILTKRTTETYAHGDIRSKVVFDRAHDSYLVLDVGWNGYDRIHDALIHVEVLDGKVWIQFDGTEDGIASVVETCVSHAIQGLIVGNTTITRPAGLRSSDAREAGGLIWTYLGPAEKCPAAESSCPAAACEFVARWR